MKKSVQRALISVSDKTGVVEFAKALNELGVEILSTGGTARLLTDEGVPVVQVADYTGFPEMMGGRIKTLHPKVHGGILGRRDEPGDMQAMSDHDIRPIDLVAINLYPFEATIAKDDCTLADAIENIDIGGPTMIRSAAKNHKDVTVVVRPEDYSVVIEEMKANAGAVSESTRLRLSKDAFACTGRYDALISQYLHGSIEDAPTFPSVYQPPFEKVQDLRYGENPHQQAAFYKTQRVSDADIAVAQQRQGKELSYNNILDMDAAWELVKEFESGAAVVIKHTNPCGVALGVDQKETFIQARETDPISAFGGILAFNRPLTVETAEEILKNFVEVVIAPGYDPKVSELFAAKKNVRLMEMPPIISNESAKADWVTKRVGGGLLVQEADRLTWDDSNLKVVSERVPSSEEMDSMKFAWIVAKHVKSNAIIYAKGYQTVGIGAGQMSRVDSARLAIDKAQQPVEGSVMASDAFFPFRDAVDAAAKTGVTAIIQPGGSIRDQEIIQAANEHNIAMVFTGIRHFKH